MLRDDFGLDSDVDVLPEFGKEAGLALLDMDRTEQELWALLERQVDLVEWSQSRWIFARGEPSLNLFGWFLDPHQYKWTRTGKWTNCDNLCGV